jgi:23S rRNA G2445 N2-methylase RlmL
MRVLVITDSGCEEACAIEIARWTKAKTVTETNIVSFEADLTTAALLGYRLQTARRVLLELMPPLDTIEDIESHNPDAEVIAQTVSEGATFKADGEILAMKPGQEEAPMDIITQELVEAVGGWGHRKLGLQVKLKSPDLVVYAVKTPECIRVGIDVVGRGLAKREHRIMLSRRSLKSTIAASTVLYAGVKEKDVILDPVADDGSIAIEAALLLSRTGPRQHERFAFEKFPGDKGDWKKDMHKDIERITAYAANLQEMKAIRTNAKLAGVDKHIHSTKVTIDWVDAKMKERSVDKIITAPIPSGKSIAPQQAAKLDDQLFYQAEYILKKQGTLTAITEKPNELLPAAEKYKFKELERRTVLMGKRDMTIIKFGR